jgi:hypothetical protein
VTSLEVVPESLIVTILTILWARKSAFALSIVTVVPDGTGAKCAWISWMSGCSGAQATAAQSFSSLIWLVSYDDRLRIAVKERIVMAKRLPRAICF